MTDITDVKGVSEDKAKQLNQNGYWLAEDLACANPLVIDQIDGMSHQLVLNALEELEVDDRFINNDQMSYHCSKCGQYFGKSMRKSVKIHQRNCNGELSEDADTERGYVL